MTDENGATHPSSDNGDDTVLKKERKGILLLCKLGGVVARKQYVMRYFWFNPFDPEFLRYAKDKDMRYVHVINLKDSVMTSKRNRDSVKAHTMVSNCHRQHKIKFVSGMQSWTLYFQSIRDFDEWLLLFSKIRSGMKTLMKHREAQIDEDWFESRYGQSGAGESGAKQRASSTTPPRKNGSRSKSPILVRRPMVMVIVELPCSMGFMRLGLDNLDWQVITVGRFKERMFEAMHLSFHQAASVLMETFTPDEESQVQMTSKYAKKRCITCKGPVRPMMSRQMFQQEQALMDGPDFYVFQVGHVFTTQAYSPSGPFDLQIRNDLFLRPGGLYQSQMQSSEDDLLLRSFEFVPSALGASQTPSKEGADWVEDETIALSTLVERYSPLRPSNIKTEPESHSPASTSSNGSSSSNVTTNVIHLVMRPMRDLPLVRFFVSVSRYTREYDAMTNFSMYVATVRHGGLKWEIRRRFQEFKDLDDALRETLSMEKKKQLAKLPSEARRRSVLSRTGENDELRVIRELNVYLREVVTDMKWDPPPPALLSFLGLLATGKNSLMQIGATRNRPLCHLDALPELAEFGDIILFRSVNPLAGLQRAVTGRCTFDHIGLVVKRSRDGYELLEATGEGVTIYPLDQRLEAYSGGFCDLIALRKVRFDRSPQALAALTEFANQVEGKPYRLTIGKLARSRIRANSSAPSSQSSRSNSSLAGDSQRKGNYFCSELVAEALRKLSVLTMEGRPDSFFLPHFFDEGGIAERYLMGGCSMDDIVFIDCKNPEVKYSETVRMGSSVAS